MNPHSPKVHSMTTRSRILALSLAALMVTTTVVTLGPAATAQEAVPTNPNVTFTVVPAIEHQFYLRFPNLGAQFSGQPNCNTRLLLLDPAGSLSGEGERLACPFTPGTPVAFTTVPRGQDGSLMPHRVVNFAGNDSFVYHHAGTIPAGSKLTVTVKSGSETVATGSFTAPAAGEQGGSITDPIPLVLEGQSGRQTFRKDQNIVVELNVQAAGVGPGGVLAPGQWTVDDTGSYLTIRPQDSLRAATWVTDERNTVRTLFAPIAADSTRAEDADRRIVGHFALQSAFGYQDASRGDDPRFRVYVNGAPREVAPGGATVLTGALNASASAPSNGTAVWSFPQGTMRYHGFGGGEYTLLTEKRHHQTSAISSGISRVFAITSQTVDLRAYTDTRLGVTESLAHTVAPGSSTTYLLQITNTATVNDTYTVNVTAPNAPAGWGATLGGPEMQARRLEVPRGETRIFTLTVNAPLGATGQIIHLVNASSGLDPNARSRDLTLVTTVGNENRPGVGVLFTTNDTRLLPGVEGQFPVYVWNRGTRAANISLELRDSGVATWTTDLSFGGSNVDRVPVGNVQPGDIAEVTLKVTGTSSASPTHTVTLNATNQDVSGISAQRDVSFALDLPSGVLLRVLDAVAGVGHIAELQAPDTVTIPDPTGQSGGTPVPNGACDTQVDCTADGVDGLWYRVWVTNSGRATERFELTSELFDDDCPNNSPPQAFFRGTPPAALGFYFRNAQGVPTSAGNIELAPGQTGELYFLLPVTRPSEPCGDETSFSSETLTFVIQARGTTSGTLARRELTAFAANNGVDQKVEAVLLEGIARQEYTSTRPIVDVSNATNRLLVGGVRPGGEVFYHVRVTNAASWSNYTDEDGDRHATDVRLSLDSIGLEAGWNVSMRFVEGALDSDAMSATRNPFARQLNLTNIEPGTGLLRAWNDKEIQIRVQAPSPKNGTAVTNAQDVVILRASMNDSDTQSTLRLQTVVTDFAQVNLRTDVGRVYAHPGDPSAFLLYLNNTGGSETPVTLRASMLNAPAGWSIEPNAQSFSLGAFKDRTFALRVTPPAGAAPGTTATVNVTASYLEFPKIGDNRSTNVSLPVTVEVVGPGSLQLATGSTETTVAPGGFANFSVTLRNTGSITVPFYLNASEIPNWTVTSSPEYGNLTPGESRTVTLVARAPADATNGSSFSSILRVVDISSGAAGTQNFDTAAFTINILGGRAIPSISVPNLEKRVDRGGTQFFEVGIRNVGSAAGRIPLEWRALDPAWNVVVRNADNALISSVFLQPNEQQNVYLNVSAPFVVPERARVPVEITAYAPDLTQRATATLSAEIHDYGVSLVLSPSSRDGIPGVATEFVARLRNTGNDNDTLNLSVNLADLVGWTVDHVQEVRLEPNQETEIRLTVRGPDDPLPTPRAYTLPVWVGTRGGQNVNLSKNMTQSAVITIPNYRSFDVDGDTQLEIAVDADKRSANGFEEFREISSAGVASRVIASPIFDGRTTYLLDVPDAERGHDGRADFWFNPETVLVYSIEHLPDLNGDGTPEYLLDTDNDGKIDQAYDTVTRTFWAVNEVSVYGDERVQYLVDMTGDGRPDRFFDPEEALVTRTQSADDLGNDFVGIDVDDDQTVDYYYNTRTQETSGAEVQNISGFAQRYWYFFVAFLALVVVSILLIVRRRRSG